jgi:hypothetical protein
MLSVTTTTTTTTTTTATTTTTTAQDFEDTLVDQEIRLNKLNVCANHILLIISNP